MRVRVCLIVTSGGVVVRGDLGQRLGRRLAAREFGVWSEGFKVACEVVGEDFLGGNVDRSEDGLFDYCCQGISRHVLYASVIPDKMFLLYRRRRAKDISESFVKLYTTLENNI